MVPETGVLDPDLQNARSSDRFHRYARTVVVGEQVLAFVNTRIMTFLRESSALIRELQSAADIDPSQDLHTGSTERVSGEADSLEHVALLKGVQEILPRRPLPSSTDLDAVLRQIKIIQITGAEPYCHTQLGQ
ncbi:hypothetical protein N7519_004648 [Penicillium mononematosum]|uniref:uncharacterized protein n=1 Tax=Penicillium mononematosum TaxID=268346 RepID=UPI002548460B|nr:uncharacterized protein N7519_004648 [Penicillium mononematosum]KAJ6189740.1 hypothetical protein N7519_004648 [Penicillium mononematosum]